MNILGISYGYHDSTTCLVIDGRVVTAVAEEKLTRQKHDSNFPKYSIDYCLKANNLKISDIDHIVYHEDPYQKFSRILTSSISGFPFTFKEFAESTKAWMSKKLWVLDDLAKNINFPEENIIYLSHHYSHALQSFMGSGFEESAILIVDAVGDWSSSSLYQGRWVDGKPEIKKVLEISFPHSLGLVYSAVTAYLGFNPNDSECSTMALASFGEPKYLEEFRQIIYASENSIYKVDQSYFNFISFYNGPVTKKFKKVFGPSRDQSSRYNFDSFKSFAQNMTSQDKRFADIACSLQTVLEERILDLCHYLKSKVSSNNLCYAGGVSMNCVANTKVLKEGIFENIYIPPEPGDGGTCIGSALYVSALHNQLHYNDIKYPVYLGAKYCEQSSLKMIEHLNFKYLNKYIDEKIPRTNSWQVLENKTAVEIVKTAAKLLHEGKIIGWYQNNAEIGPRALGNRSILFKASDTSLAKRASQLVKSRASFRPYALSILEEDAKRLIELDEKYVSNYRWMQFTAKIKDEYVEDLRGGLHVDLTSRVQIVTNEDNSTYYQLINEYRELSGFGAIVNTSFNLSGYPMVNQPSEALAMFAQTDMDALFIGKTIILKVKANESH